MLKAYLTDRNVRRVITLALFLGSLWFFRHLMLLLVFFVIFERSIGLGADVLSKRTGLKFKWCVLLVVLLSAGLAVGGVWFGVSAIRDRVPEIRQGVDAIITTIRESSLYHRYGHSLGHFRGQELLVHARNHANTALHVGASFARETLYVFIGLIFAVLFLLERDELEDLRERQPIDSIFRTLTRYFGHLADAVAITLKLQVIVAVVNALITLPVLIALGLPGIPALFAMLLVTGLVPVVGGPVAGAVLMTLAYVTKGPVGLGIFIASTFVLHKIESYYLNPKLTAKHIKLPSFVIVTSLVLFEHGFGLVGLFLSFPSLYIAAKIREEWADPDESLREEQAFAASMRSSLVAAQAKTTEALAVDAAEKR
ncbi:MAG: AI-2E family transporter [Deltaproteobacteria bacterium]|nr:AI-2E family transporter [Deltaproteobacteria bacterium]